MNGKTTIQINGQTVGLRFSYQAIKWFFEASVNNSEFFFTGGDKPDFTVEGLSKVMQCAYRYDCHLKEIEPSLTFEDFYDYVESSQETEEGQKELLRIVEVYAESSIIKKLIDSQKKSQTSQ